MLIQQLLDYIYKVIQFPITLTDRNQSLIAYSDHPFDKIDQVRAQTLLDRGTSEVSKRVSALLKSEIQPLTAPTHIFVHGEAGIQPRFVIPLYYDSALVGHLFFMDNNQTLTPADFETLETELNSIAELVYELLEQKTETNLLIENLLHRTSIEKREVAAAALQSQFGFNTSQDLSIIQLFFRPEIENKILIPLISRHFGEDSLWSQLKVGGIVILGQCSASESYSKAQSFIADSHSQGIEMQATIGKGFKNLRDAMESFATAKSAQLLLGNVGFDGVVSWENIGSWRLLLAPNQLELFTSLDQNILEFLKNGDPEDIDLAALYVNDSRSTTELAKRLHIHRGTLYYRINRLQEKYGFDINDSEIKIEFQLCLRAISLYPTGYEHVRIPKD